MSELKESTETNEDKNEAEKTEELRTLPTLIKYGQEYQFPEDAVTVLSEEIPAFIDDDDGTQVGYGNDETFLQKLKDYYTEKGLDKGKVGYIVRIIAELFVNSLKHGYRDQEIAGKSCSIVVKETDKKIIVTVQDTGHGAQKFFLIL